MRISRLLVVLWMAGQSLAALAQNPVTINLGGRVLSNVSFGAVSPFAVCVYHAKGIAVVPLSYLTADLQYRFGYDPNAAVTGQQFTASEIIVSNKAAFTQYAREEAALRSEDAPRIVDGKPLQLSSNRMIFAEVVELIPEGLIVSRNQNFMHHQKTGGGSLLVNSNRLVNLLLVGHPGQTNMAAGKPVNCIIRRDGLFGYKGHPIARCLYVSEPPPGGTNGHWLRLDERKPVVVPPKKDN